MAEAKAVYKKKKKKIKPFDAVNYIMFVVFGLIIMVPIWKVIIDSVNAVDVYQFRLLPDQFTLEGYKTILETEALMRPLINSFVTTVCGSLLGLTLSTLGGYVLIQFDMPGRNLFAVFLTITMIFSGGMIPEYLVMKELGLINKMWILVVKHGMSVYNVVLMRNFFEGIPSSLYESAKIDGCSPMGMFFRIVLPLSKAALASIGLMFAVGVWNDYSNVKIYISDLNQVNFQYKLAQMTADGGSTPNTTYAIASSTLYGACIITAFLPFMLLYPFLQKYFVKGVNIGAVKE